ANLGRVDQLATGDAQHAFEERLSVRIGRVGCDRLRDGQRLELHVAGDAGNGPTAAEDRDEQLFDGGRSIRDLLAHECPFLGEGEGQLCAFQLDWAALTEEGPERRRGPLHDFAPATTD